MSDLEVKLQETKPQVFGVTVKGRIDSETYTEFESQVKPLMDSPPKSVLLDMAGVHYVSSAGLGVVFTLMKVVKEAGGELVLCNLQPQIKKVFDIVKALPASNIFSTVEEADAYLEHIMKQELEKGGDKEES